MTLVRSICVSLGLCAVLICLPGCITDLIGGVSQNIEYQRKKEVLAEYNGLEDRTVAVLVMADLSTLYEFPDLTAKITSGLTSRIGRDVPGAQMMMPEAIIAWQYRTPQWEAMPFGDLAEALGVDRVVYVDIYEYRLNPPGNYWLWEGVCGASIGIIERDGIDPDSFVKTFNVAVEYPTITGVSRENASAVQIETGVLAEFIKKSAWKFHDHIEPKYPDKYRPELD